jgi:hypothetical protein
MASEHRPAERAALETRGQHALENAAQHEPREAVHTLQPLLRLWHYPACFAHTSWTIFGPLDSADTQLVRQVQWDRPHDMRRFSDPLEGVKQGFHTPPSVSVRDAWVAGDTLCYHLEELGRLPIPVVGIEAPFGVDGEVFGLQCCRHFLATQLQWWAEGPRAWSAFTAAVTRLRTFLAQQFG